MEIKTYEKQGLFSKHRTNKSSMHFGIWKQKWAPSLEASYMRAVAVRLTKKEGVFPASFLSGEQMETSRKLILIWAALHHCLCLSWGHVPPSFVVNLFILCSDMLLNLESTIPCTLNGHWAPGSTFCCPSQPWDYKCVQFLFFHMSTGDLNSDPHTCEAIPLAPTLIISKIRLFSYCHLVACIPSILYINYST